ncbi:MAG: DUF6252 family protein [Flavobacteriaceae bacterium]
MKTIKKTIYISFLCLSVILSSCSSDDDNNGDGDNGGTGGAEYLTAKVDGSNWAASTDFETLIGAETATANGTTNMIIQGSINSGDYIQIVISNYNGTGTYITGDDIQNTNSLSYGELVGTTGIDLWSNGFLTAILGGIGAGEIVVESDANGIVTGSFNFIGYNANDESTKNITVGEFKANIN